MSTEWPLSKSSTGRGRCQGSSVIINGWLFPETPPAWMEQDRLAGGGGGGVFQAAVPGPPPAHPGFPCTQQVLGDGSRAWLAPVTSGAECCPSPAGQCHSSGLGQGTGSSVLLSLHKGTILGAQSHPHRGTSSPASSFP